LAIKYVTERVSVNSAQLATWSAWISGDTLSLAGQCPVCAHDSPNSVPLQVSALEERAVAVDRALTVALTCTCQQAHSGRPDKVPAGCGRNWSVTATTAADGTVALSPITDPTLVTAAEALRAAGTSQLADLRSAAQKWIAGVTALFTLFGLAGTAISKTTVAGLDTGWQVGLAVCAALAVALAGLAVYWIYRAAYGWPVTRPVRDDDELRDWYAAQQAAPSVQAELLRSGVRAAAAALAVLVVAVGLLWFAPQQVTAASPVQVTLTDGSQVCGTLVPATATGTPRIRRASDGVVVPIPVRTIAGLTTVAGCLGRGDQVPATLAGQVVADGGDGHRRVAGRLVRGVEVRVPGVVQGDQLKLRVQTRGPGRAWPGVDPMAQPGGVRVQPVRLPERQFERRVLRVLEDEQRMPGLESVRADPADPAAPRRVRQLFGPPDGLIAGRAPDPEQGEIKLVEGGQPSGGIGQDIDGARRPGRRQPVVRETEHHPLIHHGPVLGPPVVETQPRLSGIGHPVDQRRDDVEVREADIGTDQEPGAHRRSQPGRDLDPAHLRLELAQLGPPGADVQERGGFEDDPLQARPVRAIGRRGQADLLGDVPQGRVTRPRLAGGADELEHPALGVGGPDEPVHADLVIHRGRGEV
jgi:hypothetical protein